METAVPAATITTRKLTARHWLVIWVSISALLGILRFNDIPVGSFWDDAHYIVLAESLADGTGYRLTNLPGAPVEDAFPPGYPLLLVPLVTLFPENFLPLKAFSFVLWLGSLLLLWRLWRRQFTPKQALMLLALAALSPHLVGMATTVMSESPYLFFSLVVLNLLAEVEDGLGKRPWRQQMALVIGLLLSLLFTVLLRTVGITLVLGISVYLLVKYGRRYLKYLAAFLMAVGLLMVPFAWFNLRNGGTLVFSPLYFEHVLAVTQQFDEFLAAWPAAVSLSLPILASTIVPVLDLQVVPAILGAGLTQGLMWTAVLITLLGYILAIRQQTAVNWYVLLYLGLLYFWVVYTIELRVRLLLPILPFLITYFVMALWWLIQKIRIQPVRQQQIIWLVIGMLATMSIVRNGHEWQHSVTDRVVDLTAGIDWIRQNTPADAVIMSPNATPEYLYHRRPTAYSPGTFSFIPDLDIDTYLVNNDVDYIVIRPHLHIWDNTKQELDYFTETQLLPYIQADSGQFVEVYDNREANMTIYQVLKHR